jgi:cytoskeletal protein RodZ
MQFHDRRMESKLANRLMTRTVLAATAAATGLALLAGCSTSTATPVATPTATTSANGSAPSSTPAAPVQSASANAAGTASPSSVASASSTPAGRTDPNAPAGQCDDSALEVSVQHDPDADGAGQRGAFVVLRNIGRTTCRLQGTPGLSLVGGGNGEQIGKPAERITSGAKLVTLPPGRTALAQVQYTFVDENGGDFNDGKGGTVACNSEAADGYRVYPPHSYRASFTPAKTYACSTSVQWITISPVRPASDFPSFTPKV